MLSLLWAHWAKILSFLLGFAPWLWIWLRSHWLIKRGLFTSDETAYRLISLCRSGRVTTLRMSSILPRTNLRAIYQGNLPAVAQVTSSCGKDGDPFLNVGDPVRQEMLYGPILEAISSHYASKELVEASRSGRTETIGLVAGLAWIDEGISRPYRVLVVPVNHLRLMGTLQQDREAGRVVIPKNWRFLEKALQLMAIRYQEEMAKHGCLQTLVYLEVEHLNSRPKPKRVKYQKPRKR